MVVLGSIVSWILGSTMSFGDVGVGLLSRLGLVVLLGIYSSRGCGWFWGNNRLANSRASLIGLGLYWYPV